MTTPFSPSPSRPQVAADELTEPFDPTGLDPTGLDDDAPPRTGHAEVDRAIDGVIGLGSLPLADHPDRLAQAHEALHAQLQDEPQDGSRG